MAYGYRLDGSREIRLNELDPNDTGGLKKDEGLKRCQELGGELAELGDLLYFAGQNALLILLQGRDTSGKDGTIRELLTHMHVQSTRVVPFKVPNETERAHDFLWRIHRNTPPKGGVSIFNRSQYEDVLVPRVHRLVPEEVWERRYAQINHFEELLHDEGTVVVKFYLHIDKKEQEERLLDREKEQDKAWKLSVGDWKERELWDKYTSAYEDALNRCATRHAPWYVIPANHKWYRNVAVLDTLVRVLRPFQDRWHAALDEIGQKALAEIRAYREHA